MYIRLRITRIEFTEMKVEPAAAGPQREHLTIVFLYEHLLMISGRSMINEAKHQDLQVSLTRLKMQEKAPTLTNIGNVLTSCASVSEKHRPTTEQRNKQKRTETHDGNGVRLNRPTPQNKATRRRRVDAYWLLTGFQSVFLSPWTLPCLIICPTNTGTCAPLPGASAAQLCTERAPWR